jgi:hypothetical protein
LAEVAGSWRNLPEVWRKLTEFAGSLTEVDGSWPRIIPGNFTWVCLWYYFSNTGVFLLPKNFQEPILRSWVTYNARAVKINVATSSLVRFENKNISFNFPKTLPPATALAL